jgi:predicted P-loop ATPase
MLFSILAGGAKFFSDSLKTFEGQKAQEGVRGKWIIEIAEMQTLDKTNVNAAKGFMSQDTDYYRAAYGEEAKDYPRQCAFFGTSNDYECLRDNTGGRRFWPVQTDEIPRKKDVAVDLPIERDQIWAEAVAYWRMGETWYLSNELEEVAARIQEEHRETHPWEDTITDFVNKEIPVDWENWELPARRAYWDGKANYAGGTKPRNKICILEIWLEALEGISVNRITLADKRIIRGTLNNIPGWSRSPLAMRFGKVYGIQKGYVKG